MPSKCKICRRLGVSVCGKEKCALKRRPSPPGEKRKRRSRGFSEYGRELREKQKLRNLYGLREAQFKRMVKQVLDFGGKTDKDAPQLLLRFLEGRLDNVIFRSGLAVSRLQARQLVSHGHFLVNGKSINAPSYQVKKNDVIKLKQGKIKKSFFQNLSPRIQKQKTPSWLRLSVKDLEIKIIEEPSLPESELPVEISLIFEYYSR